MDINCLYILIRIFLNPKILFLNHKIYVKIMLGYGIITAKTYCVSPLTVKRFAHKLHHDPLRTWVINLHRV